MSLNIWTQCGGKSSFKAYDKPVWRVVEAQHIVSTRKLVDSDDEHRLLEDLIEQSKPAPLQVSEQRGLHYLLATPFRYPPLKHGSRFGTRFEPGIWYGSETQRAAFAETAYYRLLFLEGTTAELGRLELELSAFKAQVRTRKAVDTTKAPFAMFADSITSKTDYTHSQPLGHAARKGSAELVRYVSARDTEAGINVALFTPKAFASKKPSVPEAWVCTVTKQAVEVAKKDFFKRLSLRFPREDFLVDSRLPHPSW